MRMFKRFAREDRGAGMVEYAMIVSLISLMSFSAVTLVGDSTEEKFTDVTEALDHDAVSEESGEGIPAGSGGGGGPATTTSTTAPTTTSTTHATTTTTAPTTTTTTVPPAPLTEFGSKPHTAGTDSDVTSWDNREDEGEWQGSVTYSNDWIEDQYLTIEITEIDHRGDRTKTTRELKVPAGGNATQDWEADFRESRGNKRGVVTMEFKVVNVKTHDHNGQEQNHPQTGATTTVESPDLP